MLLQGAEQKGEQGPGEEGGECEAVQGKDF